VVYSSAPTITFYWHYLYHTPSIYISNEMKHNKTKSSLSLTFTSITLTNGDF